MITVAEPASLHAGETRHGWSNFEKCPGARVFAICLLISSLVPLLVWIEVQTDPCFLGFVASVTAVTTLSTLVLSDGFVRNEQTTTVGDAA